MYKLITMKIVYLVNARKELNKSNLVQEISC